MYQPLLCCAVLKDRLTLI